MRTFADVGVEDALAETDVLRGSFHELVGIDVFDGALQREAQGGSQLGGLVLAGRTHVVEVLFLHGVDRKVADAWVFTHQHTAVNRIAGSDEEDAAFFERLQGERGGGAGIHGNERARGAVLDFTGVRRVFLEQVGHDTVAGRQVDQLGFETDQTAGRDGGLDENAAGSLGVHVLHQALAVHEDFQDALGVVARCFDVEGLVRFEEFSGVVAAENHDRAGDENFESFAAHLLDEHGDLHGSAGGDVEDAGHVGVLDLDGNVGFQLTHQTLADGATGDVFAFLAGERAVVDGELHRHGRRVDGNERKWFLIGAAGDGFADVDILNTGGDADDAARAATVGVGGGEAGVGEGFEDLGLHLGAVLAEKEDGVALFHAATEDLADGDAADVFIPLDVGNEHEEWRFRISFRFGDVLDDLAEKRDAVFPLVAGMVHEIAVAGGAIDEGGVELFLVGVEVEEEFEHLVVDFFRSGERAVDLVDDDDRLEAFLHRLAEHEAGLSLRAAGCVDDEEDAIDHFHDAFHFGAEVGVARGVDDVDGVTFPENGGVFRLDGDALFAFEVHGVHGALGGGLVFTVGAARLQELVDEGGFPMVNVGNDGEISNFQRHGNDWIMDGLREKGGGLCTVFTGMARRDSGESFCCGGENGIYPSPQLRESARAKNFLPSRAWRNMTAKISYFGIRSGNSFRPAALARSRWRRSSEQSVSAPRWRAAAMWRMSSERAGMTGVCFLESSRALR